ncbi:hypothetical protein D9M69_558400 [compost metagenome]
MALLVEGGKAMRADKTDNALVAKPSNQPAILAELSVLRTATGARRPLLLFHLILWQKKSAAVFRCGTVLGRGCMGVATPIPRLPCFRRKVFDLLDQVISRFFAEPGLQLHALFCYFDKIRRVFVQERLT